MSKKEIGILVINGPLPPPFGGVATYLSHALPYLSRQGIVVHTLIDHKPREEKIYAKYEAEGVHIHYGGGTKLQRLKSIIRHLPLWLSTYRTSKLGIKLFISNLKSIVGWLDPAENIVNSENVDIIHAYDYPWAQGFVASYLAKKYNKKFIQTTFGEIVPHKEEMVQHDSYGEKYRFFVKDVLQEAEVVIALSEHCRQEIDYVGIDPQKTKVSYWGSDVSYFNPNNDTSKIRTKYNLGDSPVVLFQGQVRPRKGPQVLLEAIPEVVKGFPEVKFLFVGPDYQMTDQLLARASELGIRENVIFTGPVPWSDLPLFFAACDIFIFPTCTPIECLGLSMIQAMASEKPLIASRIDGIPEVIDNNVTGFLVEPGSSVELSEKINRLLSDTDLRLRMGGAARERAVRLFDENISIIDLEKLYRSISRTAG